MNYESKNLTELLPKSWISLIDENILQNTNNLLNNEISKCKNTFHEIYPYQQYDIFKIFHINSLNDIKVVILGQDPYYANKFQANGIAFSVNNNVILPPSLRNIYKELNYNYSQFNNISYSGNLLNWVQQGVFMLNASLTVKQKHPNSHNYIWEEFTTHIIDIISKKRENIIFVAWGNCALNRFKNIDLNKHILLTSSHPSPLSCYKTENPFIGSNIFLKINEILKNKNSIEIIW